MFRTPSRRRTPSRHRTTGILAAAATGATALALVAGVSTAQAATPPASSSVGLTASTSSAKTTLPLPVRAFRVTDFGRLVAKAPTQLKTDLKALKGKTPAERRAGLLAIEKKAETGGYGSAVETVVTKAEALWKAAPAELKSDVKSLKGDTRAQKKAELKVIRHKAVTGVYGATVEQDEKAIVAALKAMPKPAKSSSEASTSSATV